MVDRQGIAAVPAARGLASPWPFFAFVFVWTWLFWILAAATRTNVQSWSGAALLVAGLCGPAIGGIGFTYLTRDAAGIRDYWRRLIDLSRIGVHWYLVIALLPVAVMALAILLDRIAGNATAPALAGKRLAGLAPVSIVPFVLRVLLYGPIPEEMGWRGYILDRLLERWNAARASLVLGAIWGIWHLPLFFFPGMYHQAQGAFSLWFWLFLVQAIAVTIVFTFLFSNTRRSTLAAILFHFSLNVAYELGDATARTNLLAALLWIAAAGLIVARCGATLKVRGAASESGVSK